MDHRVGKRPDGKTGSEPCAGWSIPADCRAITRVRDQCSPQKPRSDIGCSPNDALLGGPKIEGPELVQETFRSTNPPGEFQTAWSRFLHDGLATHVQPRDRSSSFSANAGGQQNQSSWTLPPAPTPDSPEI